MFKMTSNLHLRTIKMRTIKMRTINFGLTKDEIKKFLKILSLVSTKNISGNRTYWQNERVEKNELNGKRNVSRTTSIVSLVNQVRRLVDASYLSLTNLLNWPNHAIE